MRTSIIWRCLVIAIVVAVSALVLWFYPFKLGLDLQGGVHLVLKVDAKPGELAEAVEQARRTIERRVNELGVAEPVIAVQGSQRDQLLVELPGVSEVERAKEIIRTTGLLELSLVDGQRLTPIIRGDDIRSARPTLDENNQPAVSFTLSSAAAERFATFTASNIGRQLAIVVDGTVQSSPFIEDRIAGDGIIRGGYTMQEAQDLAVVLRTGALSAPMHYIEQHTIGASLGADSIRAGTTAAIAGAGMVCSFMVAYYRWSGVNAVAAMLINVLILLALMAYIGVVLTLPGITGLILTMGIGVDSNILIFERIKEELARGERASAAIRTGFSRVFLTLLDTHVSALIAAAFLYQFGTGLVRGFALTLTLGLAVNLFTSTFVSRTLFAVGRRVRGTSAVSI